MTEKPATAPASDASGWRQGWGPTRRSAKGLGAFGDISCDRWASFEGLGLRAWTATRQREPQLL